MVAGHLRSWTGVVMAAGAARQVMGKGGWKAGTLPAWQVVATMSRGLHHICRVSPTAELAVRLRDSWRF